LQFNQVKLVGDAPLTVPTEKVWKIESATLSIKDGIRVPPRFIIGTDTIVMGYDSYTTSQLENVVSVKLEWKGSNTGGNVTCSGCGIGSSSNGSNSVSINVGGVAQGSSILNDNLSFNNIPSGSNGNYVNIGTTTLTNSANNVVSNWTLFFTPISNPHCGNSALYGFSWGTNYSFRVTFLLANGNALSYVVTHQSQGCGTTQQSVLNPTIATETKSRPQVSTQFPIWVPSGIVVKTLTNIAKLSVLEFNVIP
jgi:hypothetical protein